MEIIHQEEEFVVVNKPGGLLSVPGKDPANQDCVTSRVKAMFPHCIKQPAVHRLDMETSGLMVVALNRNFHRDLSRQFEQRQVDKTYIALLEGIINQDSGTITLPFRLDPDNRPYQVYDEVHGKVGISHWRKLGVKNNQTRIEFKPETGRTHQLRLHSYHHLGLGTPIIGDRLYGNGKDGDRMLLHAAFLSFSHPLTQKRLKFKSKPLF